MKRYIRVHPFTPNGDGAVYVSESDVNLQYILTKLLIIGTESALVPIEVLNSIVELEVPHIIMKSPIETSAGVLAIYHVPKQKSLLIRKVGD